MTVMAVKRGEQERNGSQAVPWLLVQCPRKPSPAERIERPVEANGYPAPRTIEVLVTGLSCRAARPDSQQLHEGHCLRCHLGRPRRGATVQ